MKRNLSYVDRVVRDSVGDAVASMETDGDEK